MDGNKKIGKHLCEKSHDYFREYCDNTTIHGFKYLGERKRSAVEKLWWMAILAVCFFYCYDLSMKTYDKWMQSPMIIGFKQNPVPVWDIPFPAVTVCPQTKAKQSVCNYTQLYNEWKSGANLTQKDSEQLAALSLVCAKYGPAKAGPLYLNESVLDFLARVAPQLEDMHPRCGWRQDSSVPCRKMLAPVFTVEGLCFTFNTLDRKDLYTPLTAHYKHYGRNNRRTKGWNFDKGYDNDQGLRVYPERDLYLSRKSIEQTGFSADVGLRLDDMDQLCSGTDPGFKVFLNHPAEVLKHGQQYFFVPPNQAAEIIIMPEMMVTAEDLRAYAPNVRDCYYPGEKPLAFFGTYTKRNCQMECLANLTYANFGCAAHYMPRRSGWPICGSRHGRLMDTLRDFNVAMKEAFNFNFAFEHMGKMVGKDLGAALRAAHQAETGGNGSEGYADIKLDNYQCDCRPGCNSIKYFARKYLKEFHWHQHILVNGDNANSISKYDGMRFSRIMVVYTDNRIKTSERKELFGTEDFIGNIGGLLGLFTGFSFLSAFEILYYLTLRLWCNVRERGRNRR